MTSFQPCEIRATNPLAQIGRGADSLGGLLGPLNFGPPAFLADRNGGLRASNESYARLASGFGPALPSAVGAPMPIMPGVLERVIAGGPSIEHDRIVEHDGRVRCLRFELWAAASSGPEPLVLSLVHEHTESAALSKRMREAEARFDDMARLTSDWVWELDREFCFSYVSARVTEIIGIPARFMVGQSFTACGRLEGFPEANYAGHPNRAAMAPFAGVTYEMTAADGQRRLFRLSGVPVFDAESGDFTGFRGTANDITAQAAAEARVFAAQTRLVHAIETIPQGFALFDTEGRLLLCNSAYDELLSGLNDEPIAHGLTHQQILQRAAAAGQFAGPPEAVDALIASLTEQHRDTCEGFEFKLGNGRWVMLTVERTDDGGTVEVWNDITEIRRRELAIKAAEEEARVALDAAEAGNHAKAEFLAAMSHELRTPLNAIIGFSEIIKNEMYGPVGHASYRDYATDIHASGTHLLSLISDILEFAKIEAGKLKLAERVVNLRTTFEACMRIVAPRAEQNQISVVLDLQKDLPRLKADETRLKQIVVNLLSNAVKFTPPGGTVTLSVAGNTAEGCRIAVRDTGIGIAPEDIPRALSAFGQIESQLSRRFEGTGLGLTLAKSLAEMHGGALIIESEVNVGTVVTITMPGARIVER